MNIKQIFDEIAAESSTNQKMEILKKYKDNELLKRVLYLANSKRVKFYLIQIPAYTHNKIGWTLEEALNMLMSIANREFTGQNAIDKLTGSIIVDGGVSIKKDLYMNGLFTCNTKGNFSDLVLSNSLNVSGKVYFNNTSLATNVNNGGCLTLAGGLSDLGNS
jgi:hypothetical protein